MHTHARTNTHKDKYRHTHIHIHTNTNILHTHARTHTHRHTMQSLTPSPPCSSADNSFQDFMNTFAIVSHDGHVLWMFPAVSKTYCTLDVRHFPFDRQKCKIIFISWTFNGFKVDLTYNATEVNAIYYKPKNQEWHVDKVTVERHEKTYACCIEPYPDVTFTIHMTRRSLFYIVNLIFPCLLIYAVSFLGFFLPVESGEKVNLQITILLALVVFLLIVGETLPPTPDAIPVLGKSIFLSLWNIVSRI